MTKKIKMIQYKHQATTIKKLLWPQTKHIWWRPVRKLIWGRNLKRVMRGQQCHFPKSAILRTNHKSNTFQSIKTIQQSNLNKIGIKTYGKEWGARRLNINLKQKLKYWIILRRSTRSNRSRRCTSILMILAMTLDWSTFRALN